MLLKLNLVKDVLWLTNDNYKKLRTFDLLAKKLPKISIKGLTGQIV